MGLDPTQVKIKIEFADPELISMSSQSQTDELVLGFSKDLVLIDKRGRSVVLDVGEASGQSSIDFSIPIQPQIGASRPSTQALTETTQHIESVSTSVLILQFAMNYLGGSSMSLLWTLISSQQNLCYLPILSV